jgi:hypothetical protein
MEDALQVREVRGAQFHEVGLHALFLTSLVSASRLEDNRYPQSTPSVPTEFLVTELSSQNFRAAAHR